MSGRKKGVRDLKLLTDFIALFGGEVLRKVVGFLAFAYLARTLEPANYGVVELAFAVSLFFAMVINCGLGPIGAREIADGRGNVSDLAAEIPATRVLIAVVVIPVMGFGTYLFGKSGDAVPLLWLFAMALLAAPWNQEWLFQGLEKMNTIAVGRALRALVFALGVIVVVRGSHDLLAVGIVEIVAAAALSLFYLTVQHFRVGRVSLSFSFSASQRLIRQGLSVGLAQIVWALHQSAPVVLMALFVGGDQTGWFASAHRIVMSLMTVSWIYHANLYPTLARRIRNSPQEFEQLVYSSFRVVTWAGILFALLLTLMARPVLVTLYGEPYQAAARAFAVLAWVLPVTALGGHARWSLIAAGRQQYVFLAQAAGALAMILLGVVLVPRYEAVGAAIAMLATCCVVWVVAHVFATAQIGRFPFVAVVARPALLALACGMLGVWISSSGWLAAAVGSVTFILCTPLVDPKVFSDLVLLVHAKSDVQTRSPVR